MSAGTAIKSFFKVFTDEPFTYIVNLPIHEVENKLKRLLDHGGFWAVPNIIGEVKGSNFSARQRRVYLYRRTLTNELDGKIKKVANGVAIHIILRTDFAATLFFIISISASLILLFAAIFLSESIIKDITKSEQVLIGFVLLPVSLIFWSMLSCRKRQLRQTFEEAMDIQPIDTHSM